MKTIVLLSLTQLSAYALYLMGAIYLCLSAYAVLGGWWGTADRKARLSWFLIMPIAIFITLWLAGRWIWAVFYWGFVVGDDGPYEEYANITSGIVALVTAATICARQIFGRSNRSYRRITSWCTAAIATFLFAMLAFEYASRIDGLTARGAAETYFSKFRGERHPFATPGAPGRIVEENLPDTGPFPKPVRRFVLYYGNGPIQEVKVAPYGWFWWTFASSGPAHPTFEMDSAVANWESDPEKSSQQLNAIITNYPNSEASRWAEKTLESLNTHGKQNVSSWRAEMMQKLREGSQKR